MNRKSKVIVSIVGITIVLLALLGFTYAYYLTRIEGNTNTNSISITTADLKLVYSENSPEIITENNIMPGTTIGEKTFTVSNTGNTLVEDYKVVLEYAVLEGIVPSVFVRPQDFEITMTCVSKNIQTNNVSGTCSGYTGKWNNESFEMTTNDIAENIKHEYTLTIFYANPDIDQSDDMGKNLNLKVQIYGANETSTITGTIDNVDETYAMKLNSNPKISTIKNVGTKENPKYQYKFIGVEPNDEGESHTLTLVDKNDSTQSTGTITIKKGTNANISGSTITVKDNQTNIYLTTGSGSTTLTNTATFNPYSDNTNSLAYHILNNAKTNKNGTIYSDNPITTPAKGSGNIVYTSYTDPTSFSNTSSYTSKWYVYGTAITMDKDGYFKITNPQVGKFSSVATSMINGYIPTYSGYADEESARAAMYNEFFGVYKVGTSTTTSELYYKAVTKNSENIESVLSVTADDYGTSYYYRGGVTDNYVNFAGMCWKIVRIEGDGSIKLILEDRFAECNDNEDTDGIKDTEDYAYTGDWSNYTAYNFGYSWNNKTWRFNFLNYTGGLADSFKTFQTTELASYLDKLKVEEWCYDDNVTKLEHFDSDYNPVPTPVDGGFTDEYYGAYTRIVINKKPSLKCNGTKLTKFKDNTDMYVGTLTADEAAYAGLNSNYTYLSNNYNIDNNLVWWVLSPSYFEGEAQMAFPFCVKDSLSVTQISDEKYSRPAVTLKSGSVITGGEGTLEKPYIIG